MKDNKISISLTTFIIVAVIVGVLIVCLIFYIIYSNFVNKALENRLEQDQMEESIIDSLPSIDTDDDSDDMIFTTNNNDNTSNNIFTDEEDISNPLTSDSITGKSSSKQSPLPIGEWGIASKYVSGEYVNVPARITNVTRGATAAQKVKNYCESGSSIYKYEDAKEGMEWAVIEYNVDLTKMEKDSSARLDTKITGTGDNSSIKYNGYTYIVSTMNMASGYTKGEIITCEFAVQLPIGCTEYLIALGSSSDTQAFFVGK